MSYDIIFFQYLNINCLVDGGSPTAQHDALFFLNSIFSPENILFSFGSFLCRENMFFILNEIVIFVESFFFNRVKVAALTQAKTINPNCQSQMPRRLSSVFPLNAKICVD